MRNKIFVIFGLLLVLSGWGYSFSQVTAASNVVTFNDNNLKAAIYKVLKKNIEDDITSSELSGITSLDLSNNEIIDLTGLKEAANLQKLILNNNQVVNIIELTSLKKLTDLSLNGNQISDISDLKDLVSLQKLQLNNNQIRDINGLASLTKLVELSLNNNQINDLTSLSNLTGLQKLSLSHNRILDVNALSSLTKLKELSLEDNLINDIGVLKRLVLLTGLNVDKNKLSDISGISSIGLLTNLQSLSLNENNISNISVLGSLANLEYLALNNNQIKDISILSGLTKLRSLFLDNAPVKDFNALSKLTLLEVVSLNGNQISNINILSNLANIKSLSLNDLQLTNITVLSKLVNIKNLSLNGNKLTDISTLNKLLLLEELSLNKNQIKDISGLGKLLKLKTLELNDNLIEDISVLGDLIELTRVSLLNNTLSEDIALRVIEILKNRGVNVTYSDHIQLPKEGIFADGRIRLIGENNGSLLKLSIKYRDLPAGFTGMQINIPLPNEVTEKPTFEINTSAGLDAAQDIQIDEVLNGKVYTLLIGGQRLGNTPLGTSETLVGTLSFNLSTPVYKDINLGIDQIIINVNDIAQPAISISNVSMVVPFIASITVPADYRLYDVNRDGQVNITDATLIIYYITNKDEIQTRFPLMPISLFREIQISNIRDEMYSYNVNLNEDGLNQVNSTDYNLIYTYIRNFDDIQTKFPNFTKFVKSSNISAKSKKSLTKEKNPFANGKIKVEGEKIGSKVNLVVSYSDLHAGFTGGEVNIKISNGLSNPAFQINTDNGLKDSDIKINQVVNGVYKVLVGGERLVASPLSTSGTLGTLSFDTAMEGDVTLDIDSIVLNVADIKDPAVSVSNVSVVASQADSSQVMSLQAGIGKISDVKMLSMAKGASQQLMLHAIYKDQTKEDVTKLANWVSDHPDVASVENGLVTVHRMGKTNITANYGDKRVTISVENNLRSLAAVIEDEVIKKPLSMKPRSEQQIQLKADYGDGSLVEIPAEEAKWRSNNPEIATIDETGIVKTSTKPGKAIITAEFGGKKASIAVDIKLKSLLAATAEGVPVKLLTLEPGETGQIILKATYTDRENTSLDVTTEAEWKSSKETVAMIDGNGQITALAKGKTIITGKFGGKTVIFTVNVK